jgi:dienelactone hydrolase
MKLESRQAEFFIYRVKFPSPLQTEVKTNNTVYGRYYWPTDLRPGAEKRPAVVCLHILGGGFTLVELLCSTLASRGIPAIWIELPYYGERKPPDGFGSLYSNPALFSDALSQAILDVRRTVDVMQALPGVNPDRVGISGISLGGILTTTAANEDPRLYRVCPILGGGNLLRMIGYAKETSKMRATMDRLPPEERKKLEEALSKVDPLTKAANLKDRAAQGRVMMFNPTEDEVIPKECAMELAEAIGMKDRITWLQGLGHYTAMAALPRILSGVADFFATDMPAGAVRKPAPVDAKEATAVLAALLRDAATLLSFPEDKKELCCFADLELTNVPGLKGKAQLRVIRAAGGRFRAEGDVPGFGKVSLGQGEFPWLVSKNGVVFRGTVKTPTADGEAPRATNALSYADTVAILKVQTAVGLFTGLALFPSALQQWADFTSLKDDQGQPVLKIAGKSKEVRGDAQLTLQNDGLTPKKLSVAAKGSTIEIAFREWQMAGAATPELFEPPAGEKTEEVEEETLHRAFSALFTVLLERMN